MRHDIGDRNIGFLKAFPKNDGRRETLRHLKRTSEEAVCVAGAVQETRPSEMLGGQGAEFLKGVAFWSIRCPGLVC